MLDRATVSGVRVDDEGIRAVAGGELVVDVLFDGRRIWSFWIQRDGRRVGRERLVPWPPALRRFLDGTTRVSLVTHLDQRLLFDEEVHLGEGTGRIAVVDERGLPLGVDKSLRLAQTFDTRSAEQVAPLLDSIEEVLGALRRAGVEAFPAYGTLLGAVREGTLIGHDSDADLGYISEHTHPVDVVLESFDLQRALVAMGYATSRYSGAAFKVDVPEADGSVRGLDVFGGFLFDGHLHLMGEIRTPFRREWIFPLGTCVLEGRKLPAPADPDRFLTATYGPGWRVPDPAFHFTTPESTHRRLNGWFRGTRVSRDAWDRVYSRPPADPTDLEPSPFARWVLGQEAGAPETLVDIGAGRGVDALWFAEQGSSVLGLDYSPNGSVQVEALARERGLDLEFRLFNLLELRSVLAGAARVAHLPGRKAVTARHVADATTAEGRANLWRACDMMLRGGGRLYLELLVRRGDGDGFARTHHVHPLSVAAVSKELGRRGATVVSREILHEESGGRRTGRLVVEWQR